MTEDTAFLPSFLLTFFFPFASLILRYIQHKCDGVILLLLHTPELPAVFPFILWFTAVTLMNGTSREQGEPLMPSALSCK